MLDLKIGFIGSGQMARALARGFVESGLVDPDKVSACDLVDDAVKQLTNEIAGLRSIRDAASIVEQSDVIFLAVKPQNVAEVAAETGKLSSEKNLLVSIAAGISLASLIAQFGTQRVIRVMPNTPALVGRGAAGYALGKGATVDDSRVVKQLLESVGIAFELKESLLDAVTGLSGSGPAYVFTMIEAMSDGGVRMGLPRAVATALAAQTVLGAAELLRSTGEHAAVLRERVASPGGTTIAGLQVLEQHGIRSAFMAAVEAATNRSTELGGEKEK